MDECGFGLMIELIYFHIPVPDVCCFWLLLRWRPFRENCVFEDGTGRRGCGEKSLFIKCYEIKLEIIASTCHRCLRSRLTVWKKADVEEKQKKTKMANTNWWNSSFMPHEPLWLQLHCITPWAPTLFLINFYGVPKKAFADAFMACLHFWAYLLDARGWRGISRPDGCSSFWGEW